MGKLSMISNCIRIVRSLLAWERILITGWWPRIGRGMINRISRGDHLLLLWRRIVASWLRLIASRLLWLVTSRLLHLVARGLLRVTRTLATLHRLCWLMNLSSVPALKLTINT